MFIKDYISKKSDLFYQICQTHKVKTLYAFGSSLTDDFDINTSDIDLLVEIDEQNPLEKGELLLSLWDKLESFFDCPVDLLTLSNLSNPYLKESIESSKKLIYEDSKQKISI